MTHGDYERLSGAEVVIIAAGFAQRPGKSRTDLLIRNVPVFREIVAEILRACPDAILLIASNPVDTMTQITREISGLPADRVIGSGTILDTARFRSLLGSHLRISPRSSMPMCSASMGIARCWLGLALVREQSRLPPSAHRLARR